MTRGIGLARAGAARIEVQDTVLSLDARTVRVAAHDDVESLCHGIHAKLLEIVDDVDPVTTELDRARVGQSLGPGAAIVVATHRERRRERFQFSKHVRDAHISGVDDELAPAKSADGFGTQFVVRIGNDPDETCARCLATLH